MENKSVADLIYEDEEKSKSVNWDELKKESEDVTLDNLKEFIEKLVENGRGSYDGAVKATGLAASAIAWIMCKKLDLTGFQASAVNFEFLRDWYYRSNKTGLRIINYDDFLYPQYEYKYQKTISKDLWDAMQKAAADEIENAKEKSYTVNESVANHWRSIIEGKVPFGYVVTEH